MGRRSEQSKKAYNQMASGYDESQEGSYTTPHKVELVKKVILKDGDAVLDVACGNGVLLEKLSKKARIHTFGIDISENMIAAAKKRHPSGTYIVQPCTPIGFEDASMDVITVSCAFHHFENSKDFAEECMRVLKNNGTVYMAEPSFSPVVRWIANTVAFPLSKRGDVKVYNSKELAAFFEAVGFRDVQTYTAGRVLFLAARKMSCTNRKVFAAKVSPDSSRKRLWASGMVLPRLEPAEY